MFIESHRVLKHRYVKIGYRSNIIEYAIREKLRIIESKTQKKNRILNICIIIVLILISGILSACSSGNKPTSDTVAPVVTTPIKIFPIPRDTISLSPPMFDGDIWALSGSNFAKAISEYSLKTGKVIKVVPVSQFSHSITSDGISQVVVGTAGPNYTGSVEFFDGLTGAPLSSLPLPVSVKAISSISSSGILIVLMQNAQSESVALVNVITKSIVATFPVSDGTISVYVGRDPYTFFALQNNDTVESVSAVTGQIQSVIELGEPGLNLTLSKTENVLLVLKCTVVVCNIGLVSTSTDQLFNTLPAPSNCIDVEIAPTDKEIYDLVNSPTASNVQVFNISSYMPVFG